MFQEHDDDSLWRSLYLQAMGYTKEGKEMS